MASGNVPSSDASSLKDPAGLSNPDSLAPEDWRTQRKESMGRVTITSGRSLTEGGEPDSNDADGQPPVKKPHIHKHRKPQHMTSESTLMDLDDSHIPDGATPFEKQMHARIKAMDRDGDGKITIQERPPAFPPRTPTPTPSVSLLCRVACRS